MYQIANNVLGTLKYDIAGGGTSLVWTPLAGSPPFNPPPAPTDGASTFGAPYGIVTLMDRLDPSAAKIEHIRYTARAAELAGAYTLTTAAGLRGQEGTSAQAWTAGAYVVQMATADVLAVNTLRALLRAQHLLVHKRDAAIKWDGSSFTFDTFIVHGAGRGNQWGSDGYFTITMPANTTTVTGFGGASNATVASGAIPIAAKTALYYEPNIAGANTSLAGNFHLVGVTSDYVVPAHWVLIAVHSEVTAGDKTLRVATGQILTPWFTIGGGAPASAFVNSWVDYAGGHEVTAMRKCNGYVELRGVIKNGTISGNAFTLPAGWRPSAPQIYGTISNGLAGFVQIDNLGQVIPNGSNVYVSLFGIRFQPEL